MGIKYSNNTVTQKSSLRRAGYPEGSNTHIIAHTPTTPHLTKLYILIGALSFTETDW